MNRGSDESGANYVNLTRFEWVRFIAIAILSLLNLTYVHVLILLQL